MFNFLFVTIMLPVLHNIFAERPWSFVDIRRIVHSLPMFLIFLNQRGEGRGAPLTCHTVSKNMYIKLLHTKLSANCLQCSAVYRFMAYYFKVNIQSR